MTTTFPHLAGGAAPGQITETQLAQLRELRASDPAAIARAHLDRARRPLLPLDGRLALLDLTDASHPRALGQRDDLLRRTARALRHPGIDGVVAAPDLLDDLVLLGALSEKIVVSTLDGAAMPAAVFELADRVAARPLTSAAATGADMASLRLRLHLDDATTAVSLERVSRAVAVSAAARLPLILEPHMSTGAAGALSEDDSSLALSTAAAIASGLGGGSSWTWLALPLTRDLEATMSASTLPILLTTGRSGSVPVPSTTGAALRDYGAQGLILRQDVLYPQEQRLDEVLDELADLVHG